jgi:hypothetical protein
MRRRVRGMFDIYIYNYNFLDYVLPSSEDEHVSNMYSRISNPSDLMKVVTP